MSGKLTEICNAPANSTKIGDIQYDIDINIENAKDVDDLIRQVKLDLQHDKKFEKMIQAQTIGVINGGSSFAKYRQNFGK